MLMSLQVVCGKKLRALLPGIFYFKFSRKQSEGEEKSVGGLRKWRFGKASKEAWRRKQGNGITRVQ